MGEEELSTAWDKTKKDARRQAAELAVRGLVANGGFGKFSSLATSVCFSYFHDLITFILAFINFLSIFLKMKKKNLNTSFILFN